MIRGAAALGEKKAMQDLTAATVDGKGSGQGVNVAVPGFVTAFLLKSRLAIRHPAGAARDAGWPCADKGLLT